VHKAHGARELRDVIEGKCPLEKAIQRSQQVTRNYAKRQFTWFKNRFMNKEKEAGRSCLTLEEGNFAKNMAESRNFMDTSLSQG